MNKEKRDRIAQYAIYVTLAVVVISIILYVVFKPKDAHAGSVCDAVTLETLKQHTPIPSAEIISKKEVLGMCEVILKIGGENVPVYATDKFVLAGELFSEKKQYTRDTLDKLSEQNNIETKKNFSSLKPKMDQVAGITYTPKGQVKHKLYMFSSPLCGFCTKASKEIQPILDETGTELKMILQGGGEARSKSIQAICKNVDLNEYNSRKWENGTAENCKLAEKKVDNANEISSKLGLKGVPTFFTEDGTMIVGANLPELKRILQKN